MEAPSKPVGIRFGGCCGSVHWRWIRGLPISIHTMIWCCKSSANSLRKARNGQAIAPYGSTPCIASKLAKFEAIPILVIMDISLSTFLLA